MASVFRNLLCESVCGCGSLSGCGDRHVVCCAHVVGNDELETVLGREVSEEREGVTRIIVMVNMERDIGTEETIIAK